MGEKERQTSKDPTKRQVYGWKKRGRQERILLRSESMGEKKRKTRNHPTKRPVYGWKKRQTRKDPTKRPVYGWKKRDRQERNQLRGESMGEKRERQDRIPQRGQSMDEQERQTRHKTVNLLNIADIFFQLLYQHAFETISTPSNKFFRHFIPLFSH